MDIPRPTANGGFTHTNASRAKISAANKGKTPWNKGKNRSEEVRARIAAGVRARNRERLLKKLEEMGLTEEEYEEQKKEEKRKREAERRARKTANGGYTPTEETKAKISKALKEKHASGQVKKRQLDPSKVRRGFTHSEETRRKISASLKKRWNNDDEYREHMKESYSKANSREETRRKISESLKRRWSDPEFREDMTKKMAESRNGREAINYDSSYRKKISEAMKKKWQDPAYREKTLTSIQQAAQNRTGETSPHRTKKKKSVTKSVDMQLITPLSATDLVRRKKKVVAKKKRSVRNVAVTPMEPRKASSSRSKLKGATRMSHHEQLGDDQLADLPKKNAKAKRKRKSSNEKDGSVSRLREERRDLFDLLYGDDDSLLVDDINQEDMGGISEESTLSKLGIVFGDEDLDAFDPYGLDDY
ncbi:NUMOD3 motif protein [Nitzschia inconspicua]|uniref:NUMOD3 motif protein n=1 Tax=Nitzschia inconspicua TaxID=303405 RepID=A0A9K3LTK3_9STRA|nr:NUMOD3 motif protein [Nitzschia inconspicua]